MENLPPPASERSHKTPAVRSLWLWPGTSQVPEPRNSPRGTGGLNVSRGGISIWRARIVYCHMVPAWLVLHLERIPPYSMPWRVKLQKNKNSMRIVRLQYVDSEWETFSAKIGNPDVRFQKDTFSNTKIGNIWMAGDATHKSTNK